MRRPVIFPVIFCGIFFLTGCATSTPVYLHVCPPLISYPPAFERAAGVQLAALPANSPLVKMTEDYIALRKAVRKC